MNPIEIYGCILGGFFVLLLSIRCFPVIETSFHYISLFISKHMTLRLALRRHRFAGPWSRADVLIQLMYLVINLFLIGFRVTSLKQAGQQAGLISMINMVPLFFGFHLSFVADLLGISLTTCRRIHRSTGAMTFVLGLVNMLIGFQSNHTNSLRVSKNLYRVIVNCGRVVV